MRLRKGSILPLIGLCLYILDLSTDSWVGRILIQNCHIRYGALIFWCIFGPSSLFAFLWEIMDTDGCPSISKIFKSLIKAVFAIPYTIFYILQYVITQNHFSLVKAKRARFIEVLFEAFPMATLGLYMAFVIQQVEILNIVSITISLMSLIFGNAISVTFNKFDTEAPASKFIFSFLSGIIDSVFRVVFISFFASLTSPWAFLLTYTAHFLCFYLLLVIKTKKLKLSFNEFLDCLLSLPSSTYDEQYSKYSFRPKSKIAFNTVALMGLIFLTIGNNSESLKRFDENNCDPTVYEYCKDICDHQEAKDDCRFYSRSDRMLRDMLILLWILLVLSTLEGVLERYWNRMPFRQFLKPITDDVGYDVNIEPQPIVVFENSPPQQKETEPDSRKKTSVVIEPRVITLKEEIK